MAAVRIPGACEAAWLFGPGPYRRPSLRRTCRPSLAATRRDSREAPAVRLSTSLDGKPAAAKPGQVDPGAASQGYDVLLYAHPAMQCTCTIDARETQYHIRAACMPGREADPLE